MSEKEKNPPAGWWEAQEKMMDMWKESMRKMASSYGTASPTAKGEDMMQPWLDTQKRMVEMWEKSFSMFQPHKLSEMYGSGGPTGWYNWWEMQQKMLDYWKSAMPYHPAAGSSSGMPDFSAWSQPFDKMYQEMMKTTAASYQEFMKLIPTGTGRETFEKMSYAGDIYKNLLALWENYMQKLPATEDKEKWQKFSADLTESYNSILDDFFSINLPEPFRTLMKSPAEMSALYQEVFTNFFQPWADVAEPLQQKYLNALKGDRGAYLDFMRTWQEAYNQSYGKVLRIPAFGLSRESTEGISAGLDSYMQFLAASNKFSAALYQVGQEVMNQLMTEMGELAEKGEAPATFREFYQHWWQTNEKAYFDLFKTESFSKMLGETVDAWVKFKKSYDDLLSDFISNNLPVPTEKEMDALYKTVYEMRKKLKEYGKTIADLNERLDAFEKEGGK